MLHHHKLLEQLQPDLVHLGLVLQLPHLVPQHHVLQVLGLPQLPQVLLLHELLHVPPGHLVQANEGPGDGVAGPVQLCQEGQAGVFIGAPSGNSTY